MNNQIWLEKYRPATLHEVVGNRQSIQALLVAIDRGNIPNMILTGPPGIGKTSTILSIARTIFTDPQQFKKAVKELNASDDRGIDVVRNQIKQFATVSVKLEPGQFKIVILDQADSLTEGAQQALRMVMSDYSQTTRFMLSCNDSSKLIDPIQSRCVLIRFTKLKQDDIAIYLKKIIKAEAVRITPDGLQAILFASDGDMRQAINNLQACFSAQGQDQVDDMCVYKICDTPPLQMLRYLLLDIKKSDFPKAVERCRELFAKGYSIFDLVNSLHRTLNLLQTQIPKEKLFEIMRLLAQLKKRVIQGLATQLQVLAWIAKSCKLP